MDKLRMKGFVLAAAGSVLWATSGIAGQYLLGYARVSPEWLTLCRLFLAGLLLLFYDALTHKGDIFSIWKNTKDGIELFLFGALGMLFTQYGYFVAIKYSNAATATVLEYLMPILIVAWYCLKYRRLPYKKELFCSLFAVAGTALIATHGNFQSLAISPKALFWGLLAALACAFYTVEPKRIIQKWRATLVIGWGMLVASIMIAPVTFYVPVTGNLGWETAAAFLYVVIFGTVLSFSMYLGSVKYIDPGETSIIAALEPLASILFSVVIFNMTFGFFELAGMLFIIVAVMVVTK
ncbi:MAG: DMT family transporter [Dialister sp.]